jgi:type I restriction enzyme S subunit
MDSSQWRELPFTRAFEDKTAQAHKVDQDQFLSSGKHPIIDQGQSFIAGYSDNPALVWKGKLPVVIFGDHTRAIKYVDFPFILGADGAKVLMPNSALWPKFAYYQLLNFNIPSAGYSRHFKFLRELSLVLPPFPEQQRIAAILARADRLRRLRRYALELSAGYMQAVFVEMFGDPVRNPRGWRVVELGDIGEIQGGLQLSSRRDDLALKAPYLRVANVYRDRLDLSEIKMIGLTEDELRRLELKPDDLLLVEGHGNIEEIGRCAMWNGSIPGCVHQNHLIRVRINRSAASSVYASRYLNGSAGRSYFREVSNTTSGLNTISTGIVKRCPILLPPINHQSKFALVVLKQERLRTQQREAARQAEQLFGALLGRAFRGEL